MTKFLRILLIEDDETDADLTERALLRSGLDCDFRRVDDREGLVEALEQFSPQLIICDFGLPKFDGFEALGIARRYDPRLPFIFASGSIGSARAEKALDFGATSYIEKGNYDSLVSYVQRMFQQSEKDGSDQDLRTG
jgi:CheY-like chemotaxis protein